MNHGAVPAIVLAATLIAGVGDVRAATAPALRLAPLRAHFDQPLEVVAPPGDRRRAFIVEETGRIWIVRDGRRLPRPFLDLSREVSPEAARRHAGGLLSLAFAPDYRTSGWFYVHFTDRHENINVEAFRRSPQTPDRAAAASGRTVLRISRPSLEHAGGQLAFGPDGLLYIGIGDGGPAGDPDNHAQDLGLLLGKILRIAPTPDAPVPYAVPDGNPFRATAGARPEIWSYGLRNPYRFAFGPSGDLYIADPGQARQEEIDHAAPGATGNYGWSCLEGTRPFNRALDCPGALAPVVDYPNDRRRCAVVGGIVADRSAGPLAGRFLYGDFCAGLIRTLAVRGGSVSDRATGLRVPQLTGFGEDGRHRLYATSLGGRVYRILVARASTAYAGLGTWIDRYDAAAWAHPESTVRAVAAQGVRTLFLQTANSKLPSALPRERLGRFIDSAHRYRLKIVAWYAPDLCHPGRDARRSEAAIRFRSAQGRRFDAFALDIESPCAHPVQRRNRRLLALSHRLRRAVGRGYPLAAIIPSPLGMQLRGRRYWPHFPFLGLHRYYDVFALMTYFTYRTHGTAAVRDFTTRDIAILRHAVRDPGVPIHSIGGEAKRATTADVRGFAAAVRTQRVAGASLYDAGATTLAMWRLLRRAVTLTPRRS